ALDSDVHAHRALEQLQVDLTNPKWLKTARLYGGLAGLGFVLEHVSVCLNKWIEQSDVDPCAEVDAALLQGIRRYPTRGSYDLIGGLAGIAVYSVERLSRPHTNNAVAKELLNLIVDRLYDEAEHTSSGITWRTSPALMPLARGKQYPAGY